MLKFDNESDFLKVNTFKENKDGSVSWHWYEGAGLSSHEGVIDKDSRAPDPEGNIIDVWQKLLDKELAGEISIQRLTQDDRDTIAQQDQINQFKANRQYLLDNAIVTTSSGNKYDADEQSISRMANAILAAQRRGVNEIKWSLADTPTGVMTDVTLADLEEAHELAVENMARIWSI